MSTRPQACQGPLMSFQNSSGGCDKITAELRSNCAKYLHRGTQTSLSSTVPCYLRQWPICLPIIFEGAVAFTIFYLSPFPLLCPADAKTNGRHSPPCCCWGCSSRKFSEAWSWSHMQLELRITEAPAALDNDSHPPDSPIRPRFGEMTTGATTAAF